MAVEKELIARFKADVSQFLASVEKIQGTMPNVKKDFEKAGMSSGDFFKTLLAGTGIVMGASAAIHAVTGFVKESVTKYLEAEKGLILYNTVLEMSGIVSKEAKTKVDMLVTSIAKQAIVQEDVIRNMVRYGLTIGATEGTIEALSNAALGLSKVTGIDLEGSMRAALQATNGNFMALSRLLPTVKSATTDQEKLAAVNEAVVRGLKLASAEQDTAAGKIKAVNVVVGELQEALGGAIIQGLMPLLNDFTAWVTDNQENIVTFITALGVAIEALGKAVQFIAGGASREFLKGLEAIQKLTQENFEIQAKGVDDAILAELGFFKLKTDLNKKEVESEKNKLLVYHQSAEDIKKMLEKRNKEEYEALIYRGKIAQEQYEIWLKDYTWLQDMMSVQDAKGLENRKKIFDITITEVSMFNKGLKDLHPEIIKYGSAMSTTTTITDKANISYADTAAKLELISAAASSVTNLLKELGVNTEGVVEGMVGMASGGAKFAEAFKTMDIAGMIAGATEALTGFLKVLKAVFGGDGIGEAIKRENEWMGLTKEQTAALKELSKTVGDTHLATSMMLGDLIRDGFVVRDNFDKWGDRMYEIFIDLDRGKMTVDKFREAAGSAFTALIEKAQVLGTSGSSSIIKFFEELQRRGVQVKEVNDYIIGQMRAGLLEYEAYLTGDDTHLATSMMLGDLIRDGLVVRDNFNKWGDRMHEIFIDLDRGKMTVDKFREAAGSTFTALIEKAQVLGTSGSASIIRFFEELQSRGIAIAEVTKYITEQMSAALEGYKAYLIGDFSTMTIGVFEDMIAYEKKIGENQALVNGVKGIAEALIGLSNSQRLTVEQWQAFEQAGSDAYTKLTEQGFTSKEALTLLAPELSRLVFLSQEYGFAIDDQTQSLIEKAKAEGVNLDNIKTEADYMKQMATAMDTLVDLFGRAFPEALDASARSMDNLRRQAEGFAGTTYPNFPEPPPGPDQGVAVGFSGTVVGPRRFYIEPGMVEHVSIQPNTNKVGSDSAPSIQYNPTYIFQDVSRGSAAEIARKVKEAYDDDLEGLRTKLGGLT